jgi:ribosomal silencing factor RsfS
MAEDGIPWLTNRERDFLAHLTTLTIARQVPHGYAAVAEALDQLAGEGQVRLRADDENVWVLVAGKVIVHAARDWLAWAATVQTN